MPLPAPASQLTPAGYFYYGTEQPGQLAHWDAFLAWLLGSAVACALIMACSRLLLPRLVPAVWAEMVAAKRRLVAQMEAEIVRLNRETPNWLRDSGASLPRTGPPWTRQPEIARRSDATRPYTTREP